MWIGHRKGILDMTFEHYWVLHQSESKDEDEDEDKNEDKD